MCIYNGFLSVRMKLSRQGRSKGAVFHCQNTDTHTPKVMAKWLKEMVDLHKAFGTDAHRKNNEGSRAKTPVGNWSIQGPGIQSREWTVGWRETRDWELNPSAQFLMRRNKEGRGLAFGSTRGTALKHSRPGRAGHPDVKRLNNSQTNLAVRKPSS